MSGFISLSHIFISGSSLFRLPSILMSLSSHLLYSVPPYLVRLLNENRPKPLSTLRVQIKLKLTINHLTSGNGCVRVLVLYVHFAQGS